MKELAIAFVCVGMGVLSIYSKINGKDEYSFWFGVGCLLTLLSL